MDLAREETCKDNTTWTETEWSLDSGYGKQADTRFHVVAFDFGVKRNILRLLASRGCKLTVVPATTPAQAVLDLRPDGVFLSNGPGDPEPCTYAIDTIRTLLDRQLPIFGICLGHQLLALASGAQSMKMPHGHHGANHPVKDFTTEKVEITSMNHGFTIDRETLPDGVAETHVSLFDGSNCGIQVKGKPIFSVE